MIIEKNIKRTFDNWCENYHFIICVRVLMESLNEDERFDYPFFSGLSGDAFTQIYTGNSFVDSLSHDRFSPQIVDTVFSAIGYKYEYVGEKELQTNKSYWHKKVIESLNNNRMVISKGIADFDFCLICGYEQYNTLNVYGRGNKCLASNESLEKGNMLIFIGEKIKTPDIKKIYADMIMKIPECFSRTPEDGYYFGINAFQKWHETLLDDSLYENNNFDFWSIHASPLTIESENNACNYEIGFARVLLKRFSECLDDTKYVDLIKNLILII